MAQIQIGNQKVILGGIYRHPNGEIDHFNEALKSMLKHINNTKFAIISYY